MRRSLTTLACSLATVFLLSGVAQAAILYDYTVVLGLNAGPDASGLAGATATVHFEVASNATYVDRFGYPAVPASNQTITLTGTSGGVNDGTFALPLLAFYPSFAGFFTEPAGVFVEFVLPDTNTLQVRGHTVPTAAGSLVAVGNLVDPSHFAPTTPDPFAVWFSSDGSEYSWNSASITAIESSTAVPEPATLLMIGGGLAGAMGRRWRQKRRNG